MDGGSSLDGTENRNTRRHAGGLLADRVHPQLDGSVSLPSLTGRGQVWASLSRGDPADGELPPFGSRLGCDPASLRPC